MSIIFSKDNDGNLSVAMCGKVSREPEIKDTKNGRKVKFSVNYAKSRYMDCDAWMDSDIGEVAARLEHGDRALFMGTHRTWTYNDKTYQGVTVDGIFPMELIPMVVDSTAEPDETDNKNAGDYAELTDDDTDLPF